MYNVHIILNSTVLHCLLNLPVDFNMVDDTVHLLDVLNKTHFLQDLLNKQDDRGYTLLHVAAERNCHDSLKCLLIKKGMICNDCIIYDYN